MMPDREGARAGHERDVLIEPPRVQNETWSWSNERHPGPGGEMCGVKGDPRLWLIPADEAKWLRGRGNLQPDPTPRPEE